MLGLSNYPFFMINSFEGSHGFSSFDALLDEKVCVGNDVCLAYIVGVEVVFLSCNPNFLVDAREPCWTHRPGAGCTHHQHGIRLPRAYRAREAVQCVLLLCLPLSTRHTRPGRKRARTFRPTQLDTGHTHRASAKGRSKRADRSSARGR